VFIGGNYYHNGTPYEWHIRQVFEPTGWQMYCAQANKFITPEVLDTTDLLMLVKEEGNDTLGFSASGLVAKRDDPTRLFMPEVEDAIVRNVTERGMGLLCLHSSTRHPSSKKYLELIGIDGPIDHGNPDNIKVSYINPDHPITQGIPAFSLGSDQPRHVKMDESKVTVLVKMTAAQNNAEAIFGWCVERGKGRVATWLAGHEYQVWANQNYQNILWRAAHWALKRDIPQRQGGRGGFRQM